MVEFKRKRVNLKSGGSRTYYYRLVNGVSKRISKEEYYKQNGGMFGSKINSSNSFRYFNNWMKEANELLDKLLKNNININAKISEINRNNLKRKDEESLKSFKKRAIQNDIHSVKKLIDNKIYLDNLKGRHFWEGNIIKKIEGEFKPEHIKKLILYLDSNNQVIGTISDENKDDNIIIIDPANNSSGIHFKLSNRNDGKKRKIMLGTDEDTSHLKDAILEAINIGRKISDFLSIKKNYKNLINNFENKEIAYNRYLSKPDIELDEKIVPEAIDIFLRKNKNSDVIIRLLGLHLDKYMGTKYGEKFNKLEKRHFYNPQIYDDWILYHFLDYLNEKVWELYEKLENKSGIGNKYMNITERLQLIQEAILKKYKKDFVAEKFYHKRDTKGNIINTKTYKYRFNMSKSEFNTNNKI